MIAVDLENVDYMLYERKHYPQRGERFLTKLKGYLAYAHEDQKSELTDAIQQFENN